MNIELFEIYNRCFPDYRTTPERFGDCVQPEKARIIEARAENKLAGFSLIHGNSITLICVDKPFRNRGYGTDLLRKSETFIKESGAEKILLCSGEHYILQGVPVIEDRNKNAVAFFQKRGYTADWTSVNMELKLDDFDISALHIPPKPEDVTFRFIDFEKRAEKSALLEAVGDAQSDWRAVFEDCMDPVMVAEMNHRIAGFQILSLTEARFSPPGVTGVIGCVGVIHEARKKGIGLRMVAEGANWLKSSGCKLIELRYVELVDWYKKLGFYVTGKQWMGEKRI